MNANVIKDLHYERYLKILSKLHEPLHDSENDERASVNLHCSANGKLTINWSALTQSQ